MNLFENLQMMQETYTMSVEDLFDKIASMIQETFGCDIDNFEYDKKSYPKKFRAQLVIYDISYETREEIKEAIKQKLSQYKTVTVNVHLDDRYCNDGNENASVFKIRAYNDNTER